MALLPKIDAKFLPWCRGRGTYVKEVGLFSVVSFRIINCDFLQQLGQLSLPLLNVFRGFNNFISLFFNARR